VEVTSDRTFISETIRRIENKFSHTVGIH